MLPTDIAKKVSMVHSWVMIEKQKQLDRKDKVGSIYIPEQANTNLMQCKIGKLLAVAGGYTDDKGNLRHFPGQIGRYVYYTRYGKEQFDNADGGTFVFTRFEGVLAYLDVDEEKQAPILETIQPLWDRLLVKPTYTDNEQRPSGIVVVKDKHKSKHNDEYVRYEVVAVGSGKPRLSGKKLVFDTPIPCDAKVGDIVWSTRQNGGPIAWYDEKGERHQYKLLPEKECIMIEGR